MHHVRRGTGPPLLLIHGLGSSWETWETVLDRLAAHREVVAVDLPGFGRTPPLAGKPTIAALADAVAQFMTEHELERTDTVGSSMGARVVLELARRGVGGDTVALDPGGFWSNGERRYFAVSLRASIRLVRRLQPAMPALTGNPVGRTLLLGQLSARPWALPADVALREMRSLAQSPSFDDALDELIDGPLQEGAPPATTPGRVTLGWGRSDKVTLPRQALRAREKFPGAHLAWFDRSGHFPHWDRPEATVRLILDRTG